MAMTMDSSTVLTPSRPFVTLDEPREVPPGESLHYGLAWPMQTGPRSWGLMCNLRRDESPAIDFEAGSDFVPLDIHGNAGVASPVSRNHVVPDPDSGEPLVMVKYPASGGFVPKGALREDGSAHPHAGTGFGLAHAMGFPQRLLDSAERMQFPDGPHQFAELQQYRIDGEGLQVTDTRAVSIEDPAAGVSYNGTSFTAAIPDGDDLLFTLRGAGSSHQRDTLCGVARWRRGADGWRVIDFVEVPHSEGRFEPSLVRVSEGSLVFCARGPYPECSNSLRVWHSTDGKKWEIIVDEPQLLTVSPITVNVAGDGSPYVVGNPYTSDAIDDRSILLAWPVLAGGGVGDPITLLDGPATFGPTGHDRGWMLDHPSGLTIYDADGKLRHILAFRVAAGGEVTTGAVASPYTGCYAMEIRTPGAMKSVWRFA
jgi:hypothetical protein